MIDPIDEFLSGAFSRMFPEIQKPDPVDADEISEGVCAQGDAE